MTINPSAERPSRRDLTDQGVGIVSSAGRLRVFIRGARGFCLHAPAVARGSEPPARHDPASGGRDLRLASRSLISGRLPRWRLNAWFTGVHSNTSPPLFTDKPLLAAVLGPAAALPARPARHSPDVLRVCAAAAVCARRTGERAGAGPCSRLSFSLWALVIPSPARIMTARQFSRRSISGFFNLLAWQFLFISGVAIGYLPRPRARRPSRRCGPGLLIRRPSAGAVFFFLPAAPHHSLALVGPAFSASCSTSPRSAPLRLMSSFALVAYLVAVAGTRLPPPALLASRLGDARTAFPAGGRVAMRAGARLPRARQLFGQPSTDRWIVTGVTMLPRIVRRGRPVRNPAAQACGFHRVASRSHPPSAGLRRRQGE